jgi:hypothetical protein
MGNMTETEKKLEWTQTHTLTEQDIKKMMLEKLERATAQAKAQRKRESNQFA